MNGKRTGTGLNRLSKKQFKTAAYTVARSMQNDPVNVFVYGNNAGKRVQHICKATGLLIRFAHRYGHNFYLDNPAHTLVTLLKPGYPKMQAWHLVRYGRLLHVFSLSKGVYNRSAGIYGALQGMRQVKQETGLHWYVHLLCVDPALQKQGLGSRLLQASLDFIEAHNPDKLPVLLETADAGHVGFYKRFGFEPACITPLADNITHYLLRLGVKKE